VTTSHRIITPSECALAFCLPLERTSFLNGVSLQGSYSSRYKGGWQQYQKLFVSEADRTFALLRSLGVHIETSVTCAGFADMLSSGRWGAVVLFSHWYGDSVEFSNGFCGYTDIIQALPNGVRGIVDLCVCHPDALVSALLTQQTELNLRATREKSSPQIWMSFYTVFFRVLFEGRYSYFEAFELVASEFIKQSTVAES
jgi:hypothetical protein